MSAHKATDVKPIGDAARAVLNAALHRAVGDDGAPCEHGCTHVVIGQWTALGMANVGARAIARAEEEADRARR